MVQEWIDRTLFQQLIVLIVLTARKLLKNLIKFSCCSLSPLLLVPVQQIRKVTYASFQQSMQYLDYENLITAVLVYTTSSVPCL